MKKIVMAGMLVGLAVVMVGCAAGGDRFSEATPAGFWVGLWHGLICAVTFVISLFNEHVRIYEFNNSGPLYDLGFVLGAAIAFGGAGGTKACILWKSSEEKEWDEIGERVEKKVRKGIREWLDESDHKDDEWEEIARKIEEKVKRELRNWADK